MSISPLISDPAQRSVLRDGRYRLTSRMLWLWVWYSHNRGYVNLKPDTQMRMLGARSLRQVADSAHEIVASGLFQYERSTGRHWRRELDGETPAEFRTRARRSHLVQAGLRTAWLLTNLTISGPAPCSLRQVSGDLDLHPVTASRALKLLVATGLFRRFGGNGGHTPCLYARGPQVGDAHLLARLSEQYGEHAEEQYEERVGLAVQQSAGLAVQQSALLSIIGPKKIGAGASGSGRVTLSLISDEVRSTSPRGIITSSVRKSGVDHARIVDPLPTVRRVTPAHRRSSSGHFVRDASGIVEEVVGVLAEVRRRNAGMRTDAAQSRAWTREVEKLLRMMGGPAPALRLLEVTRWYSDQPSWRDDPYIPRVDSGRALREKFVRLEDAMLTRTKSGRSDETPREVLIRVLEVPRLVEVFEQTILPPAKQLRLTDDQAALAASLVSLYVGIREARVAAGMTPAVIQQLGGHTELIRRYLGWVLDHDWTATLRVLQFDSPSFAQFRREAAHAEAVGRDPVTGRSRW